MSQEFQHGRTRVAVVIPYFQRRPGVLMSALRSIFSQNNAEALDLDVIVVDDGSPFPPLADVQRLSPACRAKIRILSQDNAGPASARNCGLDAVGKDARYIAFIDSDDQWLPEHLSSAVAALQAGADLYFSDNWLDSNVSWFASHPLTSQILSTQATGNSVAELAGHDLMKILIEEPIIHLSTLVIDRKKLGSLRFVRDLDTGEDHLYTLQLADRVSKAAVNTKPTMRRGDLGINFYREALDWDSPRSAWRSLSTVTKYQTISKALAHHPEISRTAIEKADVTMQETLFLVLRNFRKFPKETLRVIADALRRWRFKCVYAPLLLCKLLRRRLQGRTDFRV